MPDTNISEQLINSLLSDEEDNAIENSKTIKATETYIAPGINFIGEFVSKLPIKIKGQVTGSISTNNTVTVCEGAILKGTVNADKIIVEGDCIGTFSSNSSTILRNTGNFRGKLITRSISSEPLAFFNGELLLPAIDRKK